MLAEGLWIRYLFHTAYTTVRSSTHGQRVWSKRTFLPRAIGLGKQYCLTFTCTLWRHDGLERKGPCTITYNCLSQGARRGAYQRLNGSQLQVPASSPSSLASWVPKIRVICSALQETWTKETTWSCYFAGHWVLQLLPYLQVKFWPKSQPHACP